MNRALVKAVVAEAAAAPDVVQARAILARALKARQPFGLSEAAAAFERDMAPVKGANVGALKAGDMEAMRGLRGLLPHLLADVNARPELAEVLAYQLGRALVEGLLRKPEGEQ